MQEHEQSPMPDLCAENRMPNLSVALPSSRRPCFMSSNSFRDSAAGRSLQGLGLLSSLHSTRGLMVPQDHSCRNSGLQEHAEGERRPEHASQDAARQTWSRDTAIDSIGLTQRATMRGARGKQPNMCAGWSPRVMAVLHQAIVRLANLNCLISSGVWWSTYAFPDSTSLTANSYSSWK